MLTMPEWQPRWYRSRQELLSFCAVSSLCWYAVFDLKLPLPEGMSMAAQIVRAAFAMKVWFPYLALAERRMAESAVPAADRLDTPLPA
jgi:FixJ family two-component response regulator